MVAPAIGGHFSRSPTSRLPLYATLMILIANRPPGCVKKKLPG